ncbi:MAG: hypothetical protein RLN83_01255 [Balneola sp.]
MEQKEELLAELVSDEELELLNQILTDREDDQILKSLINYED